MSNLARTSDAHFTQEQLNTIKNVLCPGLTDAELHLFAQVCKKTRLDPFSKQIYVTKRPTWNPETQRSEPKMTIQTGIDGFRSKAESTGKYRGQKPFQWCGDDGVWVDVWLKKTPPAAARAGVIRSDFEEPVWRVARYSAYVQTKKSGEPNSMWAKMGPEQLAKCAEALALRTAFPEELSGLYTDDEMAQADNESPYKPPPVREPQTTQPASDRVIDGEYTEPAPAALPAESDEPQEPQLRDYHALYWFTGKHKGTPIDELSDDSLASYTSRLERMLTDERWKLKAQPYYLAALREKDKRDSLKEGAELPKDDFAEKLEHDQNLLRQGINPSDTNRDWGLTDQ